MAKRRGPPGLATLDAVARCEKLGASHEFGHAPQHVGGVLVSRPVRDDCVNESSKTLALGAGHGCDSRQPHGQTREIPLAIM
jgi:hypothetical protein